MDQAAHKRIDEGIRRGPRVPDTPPTAHPGIAYPPKVRNAAIQDARTALALGETIENVATRNNVTSRVLRYWMLDDPTLSAERRAMIQWELVNCIEDMEQAPAALSLSRARERFRSWFLLAERRIQEYAPKAQLEHVFTGPVIAINVNVGDTPSSALEHQVIDSKDDNKA